MIKNSPMHAAAAHNNRVDFQVRRLLSGTHPWHLSWLCRHATLLSNIYFVYSSEGGFTSVPISEADFSIPWNVALLLGCHSRKHIFPATSPGSSIPPSSTQRETSAIN